MEQLSPEQAALVVEQELKQRVEQKASTEEVLNELEQARSALLPMEMEPGEDPFKFMGTVETCLYRLVSAQMLPLQFNLKDVDARIAELQAFLDKNKSPIVTAASIPRMVDPRRHRS